jgi:predicted transcriptional regulator
MSVETVTLRLPEAMYRRLAETARVTQRSLEEVIVHALQAGSPPGWDDVPAEFQRDLAALDRLDDGALWRVAQGRKTEAELARYDELLEKNRLGSLTDAEQLELKELRTEVERFMLRKAHAAALLRWRGHTVPSV